MRSAMRSLWIPLVALVVVALDQWTKRLVETGIPLNGSIAPFPALEPYFKIVHLTNTGAAFGILRGQSYFLIIVPIVVIVAVLAYSRRLTGSQFAIRTCLGLMLGGAAGNLIDRLQHGGRVTDFLLFSLPVGDRVYQYPAFNVADMGIVGGTIILMIITLLQERRAAAGRRTGDAEESLPLPE